MAGKKLLRKSPVDPEDTLGVKIALSHTVSEINEFLSFTQKFKMAAKNGGKTFLGGKSPADSANTLRVKNFVKNPLSRPVSEINAFVFYTEIQDGEQ